VESNPCRLDVPLADLIYYLKDGSILPGTALRTFDVCSIYDLLQGR